MSASSADREGTAPSPTCDSGDSSESTPASTANKAEETKFWETAEASLATFTSRLGGGGFGDLRIEGSKPTHAKYHKEALDIVQTLQEAIAIKNREYRLMEIAEQKKAEELQPSSKSATKMSASNTKVMERVIDQHLEKDFRDINIKMGKMAKRLEKSEKDNQQLKDELDSAKAKQKKSLGSSKHPSMTQHQGIVGRVVKLEEKTADNRRDISIIETKHDELFYDQSQMQRQVNELETNAAVAGSLTDKVKDLKTHCAGLQTKLGVAESKIKMLEDDAKDSKAEWEAEVENLNEWIASVSNFKDGLDIKTREWIADLNWCITILQRRTGLPVSEFIHADDLWNGDELNDLGERLTGGDAELD